MAKCMVGEVVAEVIADTIRHNQPPRTASDIAIITNRELTAQRKRANLTSGMVRLHSSPTTQSVKETGRDHLIAATKGKRLPDWADAHTPLAVNLEQQPGELAVVADKSGVPVVDHSVGVANGILNRLARKLPASSQRDVSSVIDSMSLLAYTVRLQQEVIDAKDDASGLAHRLLAAA